MAGAGSKHNAEVGAIVRAVRGSLSLEQASIHIDYAITGNAIRTLELGKIGREETLRAFAEGFWERICELYGEEVRARFQECDRESASDWLAQKAGFGLRYQRRPELTYEPVPENDTGRGLRGTERLTPQQLALIQAMINEMGGDG